MKKWQDEIGFMQAVTDAAMKQSSRRGFLGHLGKAGLVLASIGTGLGLATGRALANNPIPAINGYICPGPAQGVCDSCHTACISGGCKCNFDCSSGMFCFVDRCSNGSADCSWQRIADTCYFSCLLKPC